MNDVTLIILKIIVSICAALITAYVLPYLKTLRNDARYSRLLMMVTTAVQAAEQVIQASGQGEKKKAEVLSFVEEWLRKKNIQISADELDQLIESAVYQMKKQEK